MSNESALEELEKAHEHVQKAQKLAKRKVATTEIENLETMLIDCKDGVRNDMVNYGDADISDFSWQIEDD